MASEVESSMVLQDDDSDDKDDGGSGPGAMMDPSINGPGEFEDHFTKSSFQPVLSFAEARSFS